MLNAQQTVFLEWVVAVDEKSMKVWACATPACTAVKPRKAYARLCNTCHQRNSRARRKARDLAVVHEEVDDAVQESRELVAVTYSTCSIDAGPALTPRTLRKAHNRAAWASKSIRAALDIIRTDYTACSARCAPVGQVAP